MPEIEQGLSEAAGHPVHVSFTPHLMNLSRGMQCTMYVKTAPGVTAEDLRKHLAQVGCWLVAWGCWWLVVEAGSLASQGGDGGSGPSPAHGGAGAAAGEGAWGRWLVVGRPALGRLGLRERKVWKAFVRAPPGPHGATPAATPARPCRPRH